MNYDLMFQKANELVAMNMRTGVPVTPEDTICVILSGNGRVYTGRSRHQNVNGKQLMIHAEAAAIQSMQAVGESVVRTILLVSAINASPLLPCEHCLRSILVLNRANKACEIMMSDRPVPITEIGDVAEAIADYDDAKPDKPKVTEDGEPAPAPVNLLEERINSLLNAADEGMEDEPDIPEPDLKGFFGGLFRKKKK